MAYKTDLGVKMGIVKDGEFNDVHVNWLKCHFEGQYVKFEGQLA